MTAIEYRTLAELAANAGRVSTYEQLLRRVWDVDGDGDVGPIRTVIHALRTRLGDDASDPTCIFAQPRVGYRMPKGETPVPARGSCVFTVTLDMPAGVTCE